MALRIRISTHQARRTSSGRAVPHLARWGNIWLDLSGTSLLMSFTDPTSSVFADLRRRYGRVVPPQAKFGSLPFYYAMAMIHGLINQNWNPHHHIQWADSRPPTQDHVLAAWDVAETARIEYQKAQHRKIPRWTLRFAFHSLSLTPFLQYPSLPTAY